MTTNRSGASDAAPGGKADASEPSGGSFKTGEIVDGKYRIEDVVGEGGMGAVYSAINEDTGKRVAVKAVLADVANSPQAEARLRREARTVGKVNHPNVVDVYDVGEHDGVPFLVMELLSGQPLEDVVAKGPLPPADAIRLLIPAMRGIAAAHSAGVIHRDLKPDNIFLCTSPQGRLREVKVLDFGISKTYDQTLDGPTNLTRSGTIMGTPRYMSPEQLANEPVDVRTDVYSLGVILFEAISGFLPFEGDTFAVMASNKLVGKVRSLRDYSPQAPVELEACILKAIARDPEQRYRDVPAFARALEPFASGVEFGTDGIDISDITGRFGAADPTVAQVAPPTGARGRRRRTPWLLGGIAVVVLFLLGGLAGWLIFGGSRQAPVVTPLEQTGETEGSAASDPEAPSVHTPGPSPTAQETVAEEAPVPEDRVAGERETGDVEEAEARDPNAGMRGMRGPGRTGRLRLEDF